MIYGNETKQNILQIYNGARGIKNVAEKCNKYIKSPLTARDQIPYNYPYIPGKWGKSGRKPTIKESEK